MDLDLSEEQQGEVYVVRLKGRLDAVSSPLLERRMVTLLDGGKRRLLLNFGAVDYLSSAGMRLLLSVTKKLSVDKGKLVVCALNDEVMEVIRMAGFNTILNIQPNEQAALSVFAA